MLSAIFVALGTLMTHDPNGLVQGLKDWPRADRPVVPIVFFAFHIMVGAGLLMASGRRAGFT